MARVLVLSDLHLTSSAAGRVRGVATRDGLVAALEHARKNGPFERVVLAGDLAEEPRVETYRMLRDLLGDWAEGALLLAGNHDRLDPLRAVFGERAGGFDAGVGGWRLLGIDSHWPRRVAGRLGAEGLARLERALAGDERPTILFVHHPPVSVGTAWLDWTRLADAGQLAALLARTGPVRAVVHGHVHMPSERTLAGARVLGMPSTAFQFVPGSLLPRRGSAVPGYRVLDLGEGGFGTQVIYVHP